MRYQSEVERAKDKMDGINKAQENLKKNAPRGSKQNAIQSTKKSQQNIDHVLKRLRNSSDLDDLDVKITPSPIKRDNINIPKPYPVSPTSTPKKSTTKPEPKPQIPVNDYYNIWT